MHIALNKTTLWYSDSPQSRAYFSVKALRRENRAIHFLDKTAKRRRRFCALAPSCLCFPLLCRTPVSTQVRGHEILRRGLERTGGSSANICTLSWDMAAILRPYQLEGGHAFHPLGALCCIWRDPQRRARPRQAGLKDGRNEPHPARLAGPSRGMTRDGRGKNINSVYETFTDDNEKITRDQPCGWACTTRESTGLLLVCILSEYGAEHYTSCTFLA